MRVAAFQFDVQRDRTAENLAVVERGLRAAAADGCALVVLPEMWPTSFAGTADPERRTLLVAESADAVQRVGELSGELGLVVAGTGFGEPASEGTRGGEGSGAPPTNRLTIHDRGEVALVYDKVHLFSPTAEELSFTAGDAPPSVVETSAGRIAGIVCYDLRFAETVQAVAAGAPDVLVAPAQWPRPRDAHWGALVRGRAVEAQCFVVGANRTGHDVVGRRRVELDFPGNSLVADPHGRVLAEGRGEEGLVVAEVDVTVAQRLRVRVPIQKDRREGLYARWRAGS